MARRTPLVPELRRRRVVHARTGDQSLFGRGAVAGILARTWFRGSVCNRRPVQTAVVAPLWHAAIGVSIPGTEVRRRGDRHRIGTTCGEVGIHQRLRRTIRRPILTRLHAALASQRSTNESALPTHDTEPGVPR